MTDRTCSIDGCGSPLLARGWCSKHHTRWLRYGDPMAGKSHAATGVRLAEFARLAAVESDEHVYWSGPIDRGGYGLLSSRQAIPLRVHSEALRRRVPAPEGMQACHVPGLGCGRHCMNYRHLYWGTAAQNAADRDIDGTARGEGVGNARLTEADVRSIRYLAATGLTHRQIADRFDVTRSNVSLIIKRHTWAWLD